MVVLRLRIHYILLGKHIRYIFLIYNLNVQKRFKINPILLKSSVLIFFEILPYYYLTCIVFAQKKLLIFKTRIFI